MADVVCIGELLVEFISTGSNISLVDAPGFIKAPGGAPANVAVAIQQLGLNAGFVGKVGNDPFGEFLRKSLNDMGVDTDYLFIDPEARTTAVFDTVWDDGHKDVCFFRNPGADMLLHESDIGDRVFAGARCLHFGSVSLANEPAATAQRKAMSIARGRGLMLTYDPNYRPTLWPDEHTAHTVIFNEFRNCHLAKISAEEWEIATGYKDIDQGIQAVLGLGVELLVISRGDMGCLATNGKYRLELPAFPIDVVETTGAGDGFMAAMIVKLLPEREKVGSLAHVDEAIVREAMYYANAVGALTCTKPGAIPALPTRAAVDHFLATLEGTDGAG